MIRTVLKVNINSYEYFRDKGNRSAVIDLGLSKSYDQPNKMYYTQV